MEHATISLTVRLDAALHRALETWRSKQQVPPTRTAVIEAALRRFLGRQSKKEKR